MATGQLESSSSGDAVQIDDGEGLDEDDSSRGNGLVI